MQTPPQIGAPARRRFPYGVFVPIGLALALYFAVLGVLSYFKEGSDLQALGRSVLRSHPGPWDKRLAVNVGPVTTGILRAGSHFLDLPEEARAAIGAVRGAEVSFYQVPARAKPGDLGKMLASADREMAGRGWTRIVGVIQGGNLVGVYLPTQLRTSSRIKCCVVVMEGHDLFLVSARANLEPVLALIESREIKLPAEFAQFGWH